MAKTKVTLHLDPTPAYLLACSIAGMTKNPLFNLSEENAKKNIDELKKAMDDPAKVNYYLTVEQNIGLSEEEKIEFEQLKERFVKINPAPFEEAKKLQNQQGAQMSVVKDDKQEKTEN